ncbi:MAG: hypothetical protein BM562_06985 [Alphaproteobacteria bacterium MedPE-SWcel]|nr:MAG: hypothetical protein BM562_06985 [Alphaproteobacteria bacterium MedPE-SWcel]
MHDVSPLRGDGSVYAESFSRNIGILTEGEQEALAAATVLVVGSGGIGSNCLATLARMGVGGFHIVDPDIFELANINRQFGATVSNDGRFKVDVLREAILDINPDARVTVCREYFSRAIADRVFDGVDICIDAIDFYRIEDHLTFHRAARARGLYVLMGSPVGFSACLQVFDPDGMTLADYCGIRDGQPEMEKQLRYACGIVPRLAHISYYDVSKQGSNTDFMQGSGPSVASACVLAAALVASEIVMILLNRHRPRAIPHTLQYDPCTQRYEAVYLDGGMTAYDPTDVLETITDKSSLVVNIFDHFYRKVHAATLELRDGGSLCYRSEGKGPPLLLIPPVGGDTSFWARQAPQLADRFRVITVDNRGAGRSSGLPHDADCATMAADILELVAHLDLEQVVLAGCAMGGLIALQAALMAPGKIGGISLCSAYLAADDTILSVTEDWRRRARQAGMGAVFDDSIEYLFGQDYRARNADELYKLKTFYRVNEQHVDEFCKQTLIANRFAPLTDPKGISCPVQILHGGADRLVVPQHAATLASAMGAPPPVILQGAGHFLTWENAAQYNHLLTEFALAAQTEGARA